MLVCAADGISVPQESVRTLLYSTPYLVASVPITATMEKKELFGAIPITPESRTGPSLWGACSSVAARIEFPPLMMWCFGQESCYCIQYYCSYLVVDSH